MKISKMPDAYIGKEQAYVKHTILRAYLQRLFMIVGQGKENVINYVDCFAGPYNEEDGRLRDTSISISLEQMAICQQKLKKAPFGKSVSFRALYIEKNPARFKKLKSYLSKQAYSDIDVECLHGDYKELLNEIVAWCRDYFTFFFVDPMGWQKVVGAKTMMPLLQLKKAEFLINLMYDFINRFVEVGKHAQDMVELFGKVPSFKNEPPEERQAILLTLYRINLKDHYNGRTAYVTIERPGKDRVLYCLVYLTRHPRGIDVFKTAAQEMEIVQRVAQQEYKLRQQLEKSDTTDMFGSNSDMFLARNKFADNKLMAKKFILDQLSTNPIRITIYEWADFLEESDLYPDDLQAAMKELVNEGRVKNLDADVSRRRKNIIKPGWPSKSERWVLV